MACLENSLNKNHLSRGKAKYFSSEIKEDASFEANPYFI
ncbi:hypothetical protein GBAG_2957 [Buttiauxella agrestis ATCC 33320]|uniref:Uncharacterized protein n=1 Tax=Buttiauxella agrestis ATCC 33320 TaxID=1006004 RepID=A0A085G8F0_9ENTR|nr:hypothetical protein GBAG_2957 [Buttiauxella agrestis ATCC 33320]